MKRTVYLIAVAALSGACATDVSDSVVDYYEEVDATSILDAPAAQPGTYSPQSRALVERGEYLVELLGCGSCHTDGALLGDPDIEKSLAGSSIGIAYTNPLGEKQPGIIYPSNITPDEATGIGTWTDQQIGNAIRAGISRHGSRRLATMPWRGYAKISDDDVRAITGYLRRIEAVDHRVPGEVEPGERASHPFVYFGVYRSKR